MISAPSGNIVAIIPARGGSKGVPRKNLADLGGLSLVHWAIQAAKSSKYISRIIVSTDDEEIRSEAIAAEAEVPFLRPRSLATDTAEIGAVVDHSVKFLETEGFLTSIAVVLFPSHPFRTPQIINKAIELCSQHGISVLTARLLDIDTNFLVGRRDDDWFTVGSLPTKAIFQKLGLVHAHYRPAKGGRRLFLQHCSDLLGDSREEVKKKLEKLRFSLEALPEKIFPVDPGMTPSGELKQFYLPVTDSAMELDIDTPADLERGRTLLREGGVPWYPNGVKVGSPHSSVSTNKFFHLSGEKKMLNTSPAQFLHMQKLFCRGTRTTPLRSVESGATRIRGAGSRIVSVSPADDRIRDQRTEITLPHLLSPFELRVHFDNSPDLRGIAVNFFRDQGSRSEQNVETFAPTGPTLAVFREKQLGMGLGGLTVELGVARLFSWTAVPDGRIGKVPLSGKHSDRDITLTIHDPLLPDDRLILVSFGPKLIDVRDVLVLTWDGMVWKERQEKCQPEVLEGGKKITISDRERSCCTVARWVRDVDGEQVNQIETAPHHWSALTVPGFLERKTGKRFSINAVTGHQITGRQLAPELYEWCSSGFLPASVEEGEQWSIVLCSTDFPSSI